MESCEQRDITRMVRAIEAEVEVKLREIAAEADIAYREEKAVLMKEQETMLTAEFTKRKRALYREQKQLESSIKNEYNKLMQEATASTTRKIFQLVRARARKCELLQSLVEDCIVYIPKGINYLIFCNKSDEETVRKNLKDPKRATIKTLPEKAIGGVIFATHNGGIACDNSYESRIQAFKEKRLNMIGQFLSELRKKHGI